MNKPVSIDKENYILIGLTDCDEKREQRTREVQELWKKILETKGYKSTLLVFFDTYALLNEAFNSYQNGGFMATAIMCRIVVETAYYDIAVTKNLVTKKTENGQEFIEREKDECFLRLIIKYARSVEYGFYESILREKRLIDKKIKKLADRIRERGNYVAHYPTKHEKKFIMFHEGKTNDRYLWYTRKKALKQLNDTVELIRLLIMKVYNKYFETRLGQ